MLENGNAPFTHGMEVEQFPQILPSEVRDEVMNNHTGGLDDWHDDASGPRETDIGAFKNSKTILNRFYAGTRDKGVTWDWHAADSEGGQGAGAGSHVHLCLEREVFDDHIAGWTVAYNTAVEMFPFFAPYFCHDWERGFRSGTTYQGYTSSERGNLNVERWADATTTRFSQDSIRERVENPTAYNRSYDAVTFNPAQGAKPLTIELRANDAHPAMALPGLLQIRRLAGRCIERGMSIKLEDHRETIRQMYDKIYGRASEVGLMAAMQEPIEGGITFLEGRGIPGVDQREFDTMFEVLRAVQIAQPETSNSWRCRAYNLVRAGEDEYSPANNTSALWNMDAAEGYFQWENGPEDSTSAEPDQSEPVVA